MSCIVTAVVMFLTLFMPFFAQSGSQGIGSESCQRILADQPVILPTYALISPFYGDVKLKTSDGQIIPFNVFKKTPYLYTQPDKRNPVQQGYENLKTHLDLVTKTFEILHQDQVKAGRKLMPLDPDQYYEDMLSGVYEWSSERKREAQTRYHQSMFGQKSLASINKTPEVPNFLKGSILRFKVVDQTVFVKLRVHFPGKSNDQNSEVLSQVLLDLYFTSLQRAYRQYGDPKLGKAIKLLDAWNQARQNNDTVHVHMVYDKAIWNLMMSHLNLALDKWSEFEERNPTSFLWEGYGIERQTSLHSFVRHFLPLAGMTATTINVNTLEVGRRFNNHETDPLKLYFENGRSPLHGLALRNTSQKFYQWVLEDLPQDSNLWARAFTEKRLELLSELGFREPRHPDRFYLENKAQAERYWSQEKSWLLEQSLSEWKRKLDETLSKK